MTQATAPTQTAMMRKPVVFERSMIEPETIEAAVMPNSANAAQNTPEMRSERLGASFSDQGSKPVAKLKVVLLTGQP